MSECFFFPPRNESQVKGKRRALYLAADRGLTHAVGPADTSGAVAAKGTVAVTAAGSFPEFLAVLAAVGDEARRSAAAGDERIAAVAAAAAGVGKRSIAVVAAATLGQRIVDKVAAASDVGECIAASCCCCWVWRT